MGSQVHVDDSWRPIVSEGRGRYRPAGRRQLRLTAETELDDTGARAGCARSKALHRNASSTPPVFMAFDCLCQRGRDLRARPLAYRRQALEDSVTGAGLIYSAR
jgi:hypothetical protein